MQRHEILESHAEILRFHSVFDGTNACLECKYEADDKVESVFVVFFGVVSFEFNSTIPNKYLNLQEGVIFEEKTRIMRHDKKVKSYNCNINSHNFLHIEAVDFELMAGSPPTMSELFSKFVGVDFILSN